VTQPSGRRQRTGSKSGTGQGKLPVTQSQSSADTEIKKALECIAAASNEELEWNLKAIRPEDIERISRLAVSCRGDAKEFADKLAQRPDDSTAIRRAAERLHGLLGNIHPKKLIVLATWLCVTSGMLTTLAAPGTMPEINSDVAVLGLGIAITVALTADRKDD
jgi:hypothetical protein